MHSQLPFCESSAHPTTITSGNTSLMTDEFRITRRSAIKAGIAALLVPAPLLHAATQKRLPLIARAIPSSGELVPVIGIGTARGYSQVSPDNLTMLAHVLREFTSLGGRIIETSPEYGDAESVLGEIIAREGLRDSLFLADTFAVGAGRIAAAQQFVESLRRLRSDKIELLQLPVSAANAETVALAQELKAEGKARYVGVVAVGAGNHDALETLIRTAKLDFVQVDMSAEDRSAAKRILPAAVDNGVAVMIDHPFGRGDLFAHVLGKALPSWAKDIGARSWAQIFLKYLVAQPGVTVVVPGTERLEYVADNLDAGRGKLPDASLQRRIEGVVA